MTIYVQYSPTYRILCNMYGFFFSMRSLGEVIVDVFDIVVVFNTYFHCTSVAGEGGGTQGDHGLAVNR